MGSYFTLYRDKIDKKLNLMGTDFMFWHLAADIFNSAKDLCISELL